MKLSRSIIPNKYRPAPFWSWNDKLEPEELRWQIREMAKAGLGGFFMHARGGLQTEYLSQEWLDCVAACLDEAKKLNMDAWLYDENGWPSGFGGGLVNALGEVYQQKYLRYEIIDAADAADRPRTIGFYSADGSKFLGRTLPAGTVGKVMRCFYELNIYYVDNLDAKVVAEFIRVTHQFYYDNLPPVLQENLRGIFTDEPQLSRNGFLWSFVLEEEYQKAYGKDLLAELPLLFLDLEGSNAMRIRFWSLCARLFRDNFMKQIYDWCESHNWQLTGHHVLEENCHCQIVSNGSVMTQYRYYHVPGVDHLGRQSASQVAAVQVVSSANQFGQKQILTEDFALTGWACHFTGMRWIYLPQMATGINYLCHHLAGYSLRGLRKRDYPAGQAYHQPWWKDFPILNDSVSRTGMFLAEGETQTDILVVHPLSSAWKLFVNEDWDVKPIDHYSQSNERIVKSLHALQLAHHFADEEIVREIGSVDGKKFVIGNCAYDTVIIPQVSNLSANMLELLKKYHANGGCIFVVRNQAENGLLTIDGEVADRATRNWFDSLTAFDSEAAAAAAAAERYPNRVKITENGIATTEITSTWRDLELDGKKGRFHYIVNNAYRVSSKVTVTLPRTAKYVELLDMVTGKSAILDNVKATEETLSFSCTVPAAGDLALFVTDEPLTGEHTVLEDPMALPAVKELANGCAVSGKTENILTLDRCRYRVDGGEWQSDDVISLQAILLRRQADCDLEQEFEFFLDDDFDFKTPLQVAVETADRYRFALNGVAFEGKDCGYLFDKAFRRITLPGNLKPGRNVLTMKIRYTQPDSLWGSLEAAKVFESEYNKLTFESEVESIYLCGDFAVRHNGVTENMIRNSVRYDGAFTLGKPLSQCELDITDLLKSGLPFFSGVLTVRQQVILSAEEVGRIRFLRFKLWGANSCRVRVNGKDAGICCWEPFAYDLAGLLQEGENTLELELTTSLRNMLGPHHLAEGESYSVHTMSFNKDPNFIDRKPAPYNPGYNFVSFGIMDGEFAG
ncbi:MAG: hypothetical protein IJZ19_00390 [Lentisphaeria bacterium]|nr:hypothetical protein [Lentisphaeria bacterium]